MTFLLPSPARVVLKGSTPELREPPAMAPQPLCCSVLGLAAGFACQPHTHIPLVHSFGSPLSPCMGAQKRCLLNRQQACRVRVEKDGCRSHPALHLSQTKQGPLCTAWCPDRFTALVCSVKYGFLSVPGRAGKQHFCRRSFVFFLFQVFHAWFSLSLSSLRNEDCKTLLSWHSLAEVPPTHTIYSEHCCFTAWELTPNN